MKFETELILSRTDPDLEEILKKDMDNISAPGYLPLYSIKYSGKIYLCCVCGGFIGELCEKKMRGDFFQIAENPSLNITHIGYCTLRALYRAGSVDAGTIFAEILNGPTPVYKKMISAFKKADLNGFKQICFLTKIDSKAHGNVLKSFNVIGFKYV